MYNEDINLFIVNVVINVIGYFVTYFVTYFYQIEREKKEARRQKLLVASQDLDGRVDMNGKDSENGTLLPNNTAATIIPMNADSVA